MQEVSFDGRVMNAPETDPNGVIGKDTLFHFSQDEKIITAAYKGGRVLQGFLIGKVEEAKLLFQYTQMDDSGKLDGGHSVCDIDILEDGRIRLTEHFNWSTRESAGTNIIEERP